MIRTIDVKFSDSIAALPPPPDSQRLLRGNGEAEIEFTYPFTYQPRSIADQIETLKKFFSDLDFGDERFARIPLPEGAEAYFAIPRVKAIAPTYCEAVHKVVSILASERHLCNNCEKMIVPKYMRQDDRSADAWEMIGKRQDGKILVVPAQFGMKHRGISVANVRIAMAGNISETIEFGLGPFEVGIMLLTHPERLAGRDDLGIDCVGSSCSHDFNNKFDWTMYFNVYRKVMSGKEKMPDPPKDVLALSAYFDSASCRDTGSCSAFLTEATCGALPH